MKKKTKKKIQFIVIYDGSFEVGDQVAVKPFMICNSLDEAKDFIESQCYNSGLGDDICLDEFRVYELGPELKVAVTFIKEPRYTATIGGRSESHKNY